MGLMVGVSKTKESDMAKSRVCNLCSNSGVELLLFAQSNSGWVKCRACDGTGDYRGKKCRKCDGDGKVQCPNSDKDWH